jgi:hypothetical protein
MCLDPDGVIRVTELTAVLDDDSTKMDFEIVTENCIEARRPFWTTATTMTAEIYDQDLLFEQPQEEATPVTATAHESMSRCATATPTRISSWGRLG